jgi:hypothetical protein
MKMEPISAIFTDLNRHWLPDPGAFGILIPMAVWFHVYSIEGEFPRKAGMAESNKSLKA